MLDSVTPSSQGPNRRELLKLGALAGIGAATAGLAGCAAGERRPMMGGAPEQPLATPKMERVRIGFVGVGGMGSNHVNQLLKVPGAEIHAVCDIREDRTKWATEAVTKAGQPAPKVYGKNDRDFERMCAEMELDLVYTATPWEWHVPVCLAAMKNGKHAATEVPAAYRIEDCWALVENAEKHRKHCVMMENCNYDRAEMMVLNMVRQGVFGEVLHGECGYLHDLRGIKFSDNGEGLWRRAHAIKRNGNLYPTHGLGPVANCLNINRGDKYDYLVSMSGPSRGLQDWQKEHLKADDPRRNEKYVLGDKNLSLIKTASGKTIYLVHDTNLPRPYSRLFTIQGTKGLYMGYPDRFYIEGRSKNDEWDKGLDGYTEFEHPLWKSEDVKKASGGHGGMDYLEDYRLITCLRRGEPLDMDVYDAAALSSMCELTEKSVAKSGEPVQVPDFTRGQWKTRKPWAIVG